MGKDVSPEQVGDIELDMARLESESDLKVYVTDMPPGNRALTIQDELITLASPPKIAAASDVERTRTGVVAKLRAETFNHFPANPRASTSPRSSRSTAESAPDSRLPPRRAGACTAHAASRPDLKAPAPAVVVLESPGEERNRLGHVRRSDQGAMGEGGRGDAGNRRHLVG